MAISNCKEVAVFHATEVGNRYPGILILFVGVGRGLPGFGSKSKLSNTVGVHLVGVRCVKTICNVLHLSKRQWLREVLLLFWCNWQGGSQRSRGRCLMRLRTRVSKSSLQLISRLLLGRFFTFLNIWELILLQNRIKIRFWSFVALPGVFSWLSLIKLLTLTEACLYLALGSLVDIHILCLIHRLVLSVFRCLSRRN